MVLLWQACVIVVKSTLMQLPGKELEQLLEKYHNGSASSGERMLLEQWYEQLDVSKGMTMEQEHSSARSVIYEGLVKKLETRNNIASGMQEGILKKIMHPGKWNRFSRIAAVLIVGVGTIWLGQMLWRKQPVPRQQQVANNNSPVQPIEIKMMPPVRQLVARTGVTGKKKIVLPDGSVAWLNAGSVLKYPAAFSQNNRVVAVEQGEVFFSVVRDTAHPFTVYTGSVATTVLGTSFVVKQSFQKNTIEVSVRTGKVKVQKFDNSNVYANVGSHLMPGDKLRFDTAANTYQTDKVSIKGVGAFMEGKLIYEDAPLEEILYDIARKYNISIHCDNKRLRQCHYRISFDDMPLNDCLQVLAMLTSTRVDKLNDRHYNITGDSCN